MRLHLRADRREALRHLIALRPLCVFADLDVSSGRWVRHHVFTGAAPSAPRAREGQRVAWSASFDDEAPLAAPARRALAYLEAAS